MKRLSYWGLALCCFGANFALGAIAADLGRDGVDIQVATDPARVDPARDFFVTLTFSAPTNAPMRIQDLRERFRGFSVAEDFNEDPVLADGKATFVSRWRLVPKPAAEKYDLRPFAITAGNVSFYTRPVQFEGPAAREPVTGGMEIEPKKDLPPLSWKLVGLCLTGLMGIACLVVMLVWAIRKIREAIRVHQMSPIQRAYYELDRLLAKGLPGRGYYKDFYVELTMVVRRYVQRKYGIRAPNLTTEEFFAELKKGTVQSAEQSNALREFLSSADMVKFAGVEATPEMADAATGSARTYLEKDAK